MDQNHALNITEPHSTAFHRCEDEPLGIPGAIQPHGALVVMNAAQGRISHVSCNTASLLGLESADLLKMTSQQFVACLQMDAEAVHHAASSGAASVPTQLLHASTQDGRKLTVGCVVDAKRIHFEFEPSATSEQASSPWVAQAARRLRLAASRQALYTEAVRAIHHLTQFDRVVMYVFDAAWHGEVVAEAVRAGCTTYLGLRFPNTDIPAQARALYAKTAYRAVVDVDYTPVPLVSEATHAAPLDLSHCSLRSISPIHREYMRNMQAQASLSFSVMLGQRLFGLISCTHEQGPKRVAPEQRLACSAIAEMVSGLLGQENASTSEEPARVLAPSLVRKMSQLVDVSKVLFGDPPNMLGITHADGAAIYHQEQVTSCGEVPPENCIIRLIGWLKQGGLRNGVYVTDSLPSAFAEAQAYRACGCGLLAVASSEQPITLMLWFRGEISRHVDWGGKHPRLETHETLLFRPRSSFVRWQQAVHLHAQPFSDAEVASAKQLAREVEQSLVRQSLQLAQANAALERSNKELGAFAHAASHDLKEPLRGVHNFIALAQRELAEGQQASAIAPRLQTVSKLIDRMNTLISALMHYAQVGASRLDMRPTSLRQVIDPLLETLSKQPEERCVRFEVPQSLPTVLADQTLLSEVFTNLFTNAIKYNEHSEVCIEVGVAQSDTPGMVTLYVADNGIGVANEHQHEVFAIFRRLHARDKFGGGSGTGLTIAKRIVEPHGGHMWIQSLPGQGSTFFFSMRRASTLA